MADRKLVGWAAVAAAVEELTARVRKLERDSHPPIDLAPAIEEILAQRGFAPAAAPPPVSAEEVIAALQPLAELIDPAAGGLPAGAIVTRSTPLVGRAITTDDCTRAGALINRLRGHP